MKWLICTSMHDDIVSEYTAAMERSQAYVMHAQMDAALGDAVARPLNTDSEGAAHISIEGVLLDEPNAFLDLIGYPYSDYQTIAQHVALADANPDVARIVLDVNSPGGMVAGITEAANAIASSSKPVDAVVRGMAASAGYWLASQADSITATSETDMIGSVGVAVDMMTSTRVVSVASTDAPLKRPDVTTEAGRQQVRVLLDQMHEMFVDAVATGRGVSAGAVNRDFGQGGMMVARRAVDAGMIDSLAQAPTGQRLELACAKAPAGDTVPRMDLSTLKSDHPELYKAVVAQGAKQEADRVAAHIAFGRKCDEMAFAVEQIEAGNAADSLDYQLRLTERAEKAQAIAAREADAPVDVPLSAEKGDALTDDDLGFAAACERIGGVKIQLRA